jgi:DNA-binding PadR family transcriptional regulator
MLMKRRLFFSVPPVWAMAGAAPECREEPVRGRPWYLASRRRDPDRGGGQDRGGWHGGDARWGGYGHWPRGGRRARRGDVRAAVLALLDERPMHGYEIIQELSARTGGSWRPSPGSIYPTLQLLEDAGFVRGEDVEGRRIVTLTDAGRAELAVLRERVGDAPWEAFSDGGPRRQLKESFGMLAAAAMQVARTGDADQVAQVDEILRDARKRIYGILAGGD